MSSTVTIESLGKLMQGQPNSPSNSHTTTKSEGLLQLLGLHLLINGTCQ